MNDKPLLKTPGEMISEAREAQDLTIAQLSERTKIPPKVLTALELDEYHKISGPLYIKSFLRTCASDLGLDPEAVLGLYNKISGERRPGPGGADMIWEEDKVEVSRIGLPWIQIILGAGIVAILVGLGMFGLRGCGPDEDQEPGHQVEGGTENMPASSGSGPAVAVLDSAPGEDTRRESLIPAEKEAELKELADEEAEADPIPGESAPETRNFVADTLSLSWLLSPPEPVEEDRSQEEEMPVAVEVDEAPVETRLIEEDASQVTDSPIQKPEEQTTEQARDDIPAEENEAPPAIVAQEETGPEDSAGTVEIVAADSSPAESRTGDWIDSAWPLVLRVVCDSPQGIRVKRDGDREFSEVRWPTETEPAPEVPAAGFEAGRAYRQGEQLVVFWGADDHFSLILEGVRGVEVAVNGLIKDRATLRAGQEIILDKYSAGSAAGR